MWSSRCVSCSRNKGWRILWFVWGYHLWGSEIRRLAIFVFLSSSKAQRQISEEIQCGVFCFQKRFYQNRGCMCQRPPITSFVDFSIFRFNPKPQLQKKFNELIWAEYSVWFQSQVSCVGETRDSRNRDRRHLPWHIHRYVTLHIGSISHTRNL